MQKCIGLLVVALMMEQAFAQDAGWVDSIDGEMTSVTLVRHGQINLPIHPYATLRAGDQLLIRHDKTAVVLATADGKSHRVVANQSPYTVTISGSAPSIPGNVFKWVSRLFSSDDKQSDTRTLSARSVSFSKELGVPYPAQHSQRISSGQRSVYISWTGGLPPYQVRIIDESTGKPVFESREIRFGWIGTPPIDLNEGSYRLIIEDSAGARNQRIVEVLPPSLLPIMSEGDSLRVLPESTARIIEASWLASVENRQWVLEAQQRLHKLSATETTAQTVLKQIEQIKIE